MASILHLELQRLNKATCCLQVQTKGGNILENTLLNLDLVSFESIVRGSGFEL